MKGFALKLVMKRRHKRTRKWPIGKLFIIIHIEGCINFSFTNMFLETIPRKTLADRSVFSFSQVLIIYCAK